MMWMVQRILLHLLTSEAVKEVLVQTPRSSYLSESRSNTRGRITKEHGQTGFQVSGLPCPSTLTVSQQYHGQQKQQEDAQFMTGSTQRWLMHYHQSMLNTKFRIQIPTKDTGLTGQLSGHLCLGKGIDKYCLYIPPPQTNLKHLLC